MNCSYLIYIRHIMKKVAGPRGRATFQLIYILKISVHGRTVLTDNSTLISLNNFKLTYKKSQSNVSLILSTIAW